MYKYYNLFKINVLQKINFLDKSGIHFAYFRGVWGKHCYTHYIHSLSTKLSNYFNDFLLDFGIFQVISSLKIKLTAKFELKYTAVVFRNFVFHVKHFCWFWFV